MDSGSGAGESNVVPRPGAAARARAWLGRHPVLLLLVLTPGIPEYLSGSSSVTLLVLNPGLFALLLLANLGLYTPGALLVREAAVRFGKGWPTLLCLGAAYSIVEEGIALNTMFDPRASVVHSLGFYGHFLGVNWVWAAGLVMFHAVYSITLPIVLLGVALPGTRGRPLLTRRQSSVVLGVLLLDVGALFAFVWLGVGFWMGWGPFLGALAVIAALGALGLRWSPGSLDPLGPAPWASRRTLVVLGAGLFPLTLVIQGLLQSAAFPAAGTVLALALLYASYLSLVAVPLGKDPQPRHLVALAVGLLVPVILFGVAASLPVPLVVAPDLLAVLFLRHLWRAHPDAPPSLPTVPAGARW